MARAHFKQALRDLARDPGARTERVRRVLLHLRSTLSAARGTWAAYCGLSEELDPRPGLSTGEDLTWTFPAVAGDDLEFRAPASLADDAFAPSRWGVLEPKSDAPAVALASIDGFLVPGLAFDRRGVRLGRGKGFYDRALAGARGIKIGVGFAMQIANEPLPAEAHDVRMDGVVTEDGVYWTSARRL